jgi:hypothetical protein
MAWALGMFSQSNSIWHDQIYFGWNDEAFYCKFSWSYSPVGMVPPSPENLKNGSGEDQFTYYFWTYLSYVYPVFNSYEMALNMRNRSQSF